MNAATPALSHMFQQLYGDAALFAPFSTLIPIDFRRVLPFQPSDRVMDRADLIYAEAAHLANQNDTTRLALVDAYSVCGLLSAEDAAQLRPVVDYFGHDFFDLMGTLYANAGMFKCALRWYREVIVRHETAGPNADFDPDSVRASVGYCLYSLGLFPEAIAWSKACIGPVPMADAICESLIEYQAQAFDGAIRAIERATNRTRYTASATDPTLANQTTPRLMAAMKACAPFQEFYLYWVGNDAPVPGARPDIYPFKPELYGGNLRRHRMNLIFSTCGLADALVKNGNLPEARRLLYEAYLLEPGADFIQERIQSLS